MFSFAAAPIYQVSTKTKISNAALGGTCIVFIGSIYSYSMYKMKQGGEDGVDDGGLLGGLVEEELRRRKVRAKLLLELLQLVHGGGLQHEERAREL